MGEQREVHDEHSETPRHEREDLPWIQGDERQEVGRTSEEQWQPPHDQRDVRDELEVAVTEEDLRMGGWSDTLWSNVCRRTTNATTFLWN